MLGVLPVDEDPKPDDHPLIDNNPPMYDFFGFGQPGQGPSNHWQEAEIQPPPNHVLDIQPDWNAANNNDALIDMMLDLNIAPDPDDNMVEVVKEVEEDFIPIPKLNDEEIVDIEALNALADLAIQLANALQIPHLVAQTLVLYQVQIAQLT